MDRKLSPPHGQTGIRVLALTLVLALVATIFQFTVAPLAQAATWADSEPNNSMSSAKTVRTGTEYSGASSTVSDWREDYDYYAIDLPSNGLAQFNLKFPANLGTGRAYDVDIYDSTGKRIYEFDLDATESNGSWLAGQGTFLPKGRFYIRITGYNYWDTWGKTYTLNVKHTPKPAETEPNNSTSAPDVIALGTTYSGSSLSVSDWREDYDYYAIDLPSSSRVDLSLKFPANLGSDTAYYVEVFNSSGTELYEFKVLASSYSGSWLSAQSITLPKGRNYIVITGYNYLNTWGQTYTLKVSSHFKTSPTPKITGTSKVGSTLTATAGTWSPAATLKYQWTRNGAAIKGATTSKYKLTTSDAGKKIAVKVTGSKAGYKTTTKTSASRLIPYLAWKATPTPTISGKAKVGSTLTASAGKWSPAPTLKYQWLRSGKAIKGATNSKYKIVSADRGKKITVKVTGSKAGHKTTAKTSASKVIPR